MLFKLDLHEIQEKAELMENDSALAGLLFRVKCEINRAQKSTPYYYDLITLEIFIKGRRKDPKQKPFYLKVANF